jgi:uncharacterized protein YkwD
MHHRSETRRLGFVKRMLVPVIVGAALAVLAPAPTWAQAPTAGDLKQLEDRCFVLVNQARAQAGLAPYTRAPELDAAARRQSLDMATTGNFDHTGTDGSSPFDRIRAAGYDWTNAGENIAAGQATAEAVMDTWMNEPPPAGHRANILHADYKEIGISVVFQAGSEFGFYWTQDFGARAGAPTGGGGGTPTTGPTAAELEQKEVQLLDGINGERAANGFDVLRRSTRLSAVARRHAADLAQNSNAISGHTGSDGSTPQSRANDASYGGPVAESIVFSRESAAQVIDDLYAGDSDFNNLFGDWFDIGVALAYNGQAARRYFWVVVYGKE